MKGKGFELRYFRKGDEISLRKHINDKKVQKYTASIPFPYSAKDAKNWIKFCLDANKKPKKVGHIFCITNEDKVIGGIELRIKTEKAAAIGYWLGRKYWNKGIMTESVKMICDFGFTRMKFRKIYAPVLKINKSSVKVLMKNKFKKEKEIDDKVILTRIK